MYFMCVIQCLFSTLNRWVGALQIFIIIIVMLLMLMLMVMMMMLLWMQDG